MLLKTALLASLCIGVPERSEGLLTVAESSQFQATALHVEVMDFLRRLDEETEIARLDELGRTFEDRSIPLMILSNPPIRTPRQARESGKVIVLAFGNIHAGEVCGKEALMMLARELATKPNEPLLDELIIMLAPIYNADGNERIRKDNRRNQVGPVKGMGQRPNAQGLDLNRDWIKLDAPETLAMVRFYNEWDPHIIIDTHTTNGSHHRNTLTFAAPLNPSGHLPSIEFVRDHLLPTVSERLQNRTGYETFFYGNFNRAQTVWAAYSADPRFGGPYRGLRGQMSILSEAHAYASYKDRVLCTLEFVREILVYAAEHKNDILSLHDRAREATGERGVDPQPDDVVGVRHRIAAFTEPAVIRGYEMKYEEKRRPRPTGVPRDYTVVHLGRFEPTLSVRRPFAYLLSPDLASVVGKLRQHGIIVEPYLGEADVETYTVTAIHRAEREFQGHLTVSLDVMASANQRKFDEGTMIVPTAQPLGTLAVYLLEPQSADGLATWNFLDEHVKIGGEYPIHRVPSANDLH